MNNNEILEINKKERELNEKLEYVNETIEQYKSQLQEYKESHLKEFEDPKAEITDIHAIGSIKALRMEISNRDSLQEEKDKITKQREEEKAKVQEDLDYVQGTIEQYKKQLREYKESHSKEFEDSKTEITDIHAIGSIKALRMEMGKEKQLQEKMKLLNFEDENFKEVQDKATKIEEDSKKKEMQNKKT